MAYTADDLLTEVRRAGSLPSAVSTGTADGDLLAHGDSEIRDTLVPLMLGVREELYQRVFDVAVVAGTAAYRINKRASFSRLETVQWLNPNNAAVNLARLEPRRAVELSLITTQGVPYAFYLEGSRVVLFPTPSTTGTLRIRSFVRPGRLALLAASGSLPITVVSGSADTSYTLTVGMQPFANGAQIDVVSGTPSFEYLALDAPVSGASPNDGSNLNVTLPGASFTAGPPLVGDYICTADTSPFVQLPVELQPALIELVVARELRSLGKLSEAAAHSKEAERLAMMGVEALTPRTDGVDRKIVGGPQWRKQRRALQRFW